MRNKYGARRTRVGDRVFASKVEADYMRELQLREKAGDIADLFFQPVVTLVAGVTYRPDASYDVMVNGKEWRTEYVEVKGVMTDRFRLIQKLWKHSGPGPLLVVRRQGRKGWNIKRIVPEHP